MSWLLVLFFGFGISLMLIGFTVYYSQAATARRSALFLARVGGDDRRSELDLAGNATTRLAKARWLQEFLRDMPLASESASLLEQSGLPWTVARLYGLCLLLALSTVLLALSVDLSTPAACFVGAFAGAIPFLYVLRQRALRAAAFEAQLPQALELIGLFLRSGRSLPQAFVSATEEITPPAAEEFAQAADEYRLGRPLDQSLKRLSQKYPSSIGFRLFAIAVSVLGQTGGNLVEVLERIKKLLDAGVNYSLRLKALTGESRLSAWILGSLPGVFMCGAAFFNPMYFNTFFDNSTGRSVFMVFLGLWAAGCVWIRQLMKTKAM